MSWRTVLVVFAILSGALSMTFILSIGEPHLPEAVRLPLGEINQHQSERPEYTSISNAGEITLDTLPRTAWCEQVNTVLENISLNCYWPENSGATALSAEVSIDLPRTGDVIYWEFNRRTLQAVPMSHSWLLLNFGKIIGAVVFGFITIFSATVLFNLNKKRPLAPSIQT